jgi:hypothetical protein
MTLEELYKEEPWVKDLFKNPTPVDVKSLYPVYDKLYPLIFSQNGLIVPLNDNDLNKEKLNAFFKYLPDNSSPVLFIGVIRLSFLQRDKIEEWKPLVNRAYKIISEQGLENINNVFSGFLEYIEK